MMDFCPKCSIVVAPYDPGKKTVGVAVFHGHCWRAFTPWEQARLIATVPQHREPPRNGSRPD